MMKPWKLTQVEQYQPLQVIGKGANGLVYKAINVHNGHLVALKEMHVARSQVKRARNQICFLKSIDHPCILKYLDAVIKDHKIYLILEYAEGGSLASLIKRSVLSEALVKIYVKQILIGLKFLHEAGIIHRDIKGANILLTKESKIKISDFGIAVNPHGNQNTLSSAGTPFWMAPEAITGNQEVSPKTDIWSLGSTLIQMLTGNPPYHQLGPFPALISIVEDKHPPLPEASEDCLDFMHRCFVKDSQKRATASELLEHKWIRSVDKQFGQHASLKTLRLHNQSTTQQVSAVLRSKNAQNILQMVKSTLNKKHIYMNADFLFVMQLPNSIAKIDIIAQIIRHSNQAYKYSQSLCLVRSLLQMQSSTRSNKQKSIQYSLHHCQRILELLQECYQLSSRENEFVVVSNGSIRYLSFLVDLLVENKMTFVAHAVAVEKLILFVKLLLQGIGVKKAHLLHCMVYEGLACHFSDLYSFGITMENKNQSLKNSICEGILEIFLAVTENDQIEAIAQFMDNCFDRLMNLTLTARCVKTCRLNLKLLSLLAQHDPLAEKMVTSGVIVYLAQMLKMMVISKKINADYSQIANQLINFIVYFLLLSPERVHEFIKCGGAKRLKSLPKGMVLEDNERQIGLILETMAQTSF